MQVRKQRGAAPASLALVAALAPACASDGPPPSPEPVPPAAGGPAEGAEAAAVPEEATAPREPAPVGIGFATVYRTADDAVYYHRADCPRVQVSALPTPVSAAERHLEACPLCRPGP